MDPTKEVLQHTFSWKGIAIALVKAQQIHAGIWRVAPVYAPPLPLTINHGPETLPGVLNPMRGLMLVEDNTIGPLSVDAAVVNPEARILVPASGSFQ